jgi:hypothetical protein
MAGKGSHSSSKKCISLYSTFRLFHPSFPLEILNEISEEEVNKLNYLKNSIQSQETYENLSSLPWETLPNIGISSSSNIMSSKQIEAFYQKYKYAGHIVWAEKAGNIEPGFVLLNHWQQQAIKITDYSPDTGAKGIELLTGVNAGRGKMFNWPPMALEIELRDKLWQPTKVSSNIQTSEVLSLLPADMPKGAWELIFLLIISPNDIKARQAFFDTGMYASKSV